MIKIVAILLSLTLLLLAWNLYPTYPSYLEKRAKLLDNFYFQAKVPQKVVALSFDDGPSRSTKAIIKTLEYYNAPATFFLIGKKLTNKSYKLYQNPLFNVGMHTFDHKHFDRISPASIDRDFSKTITLFKQKHLTTKLFRPAYGVVNRAIIRNLKKYHLRAVLWSNDSFDWDRKRRSFSRVIKSLHSGDIILMHDHATKPQELAKLIRAIRAKGFKIVSLEELMRYKSAKP